MRHQIWQQLKVEATELVKKEPLLASHVYSCILNHECLGSALSFIVANKLSDAVVSAFTFRELFDQAFVDCDRMLTHVSHDIKAVKDRDPAADSYLTVLLNLKGFQSIQVHRLAHCLWRQDRKELARFIQSRNSEVFGVDIHPACKIGHGIMFDHATGIVIGETAVIEDNVSILQGVTLGGTGNEQGDRHPKIREGVMIGAGAKVLGNIEVAEGARIGAGSVVLSPVKAHTTVVGVPAKVVGKPCNRPAETMDQNVLALADDSLTSAWL
ncbi:serine O-acetyltransferase [Pseudoalteromonas ulvae UL12]|uniref:Serine acetyltransferase n=1 Tax=Pseudoalteromonas ulvae TaxID=107327 RepID=A0A244CU30_PSEDV|nr:serine O-acetyltransferase [Pseudoalteromonas ulvae]MBE0362943.1 serine O-acetyltransferase [Pseudoalteromonas ulvae UL12]OUL59094.1 serine O-acetyltransferase [Pseudoalteromonas ulvae]